MNINPSFIAGAEWADKTMIEKACEWFKVNFEEYVDKYENDDTVYLRVNDFIQDFCKAMEL